MHEQHLEPRHGLRSVEARLVERGERDLAESQRVRPDRLPHERERDEVGMREQRASAVAHHALDALAPAVVGRRRNVAEHGVDQLVDECGLVGHVRVDAVRRDAQPIGHPPHRDGVEAVLAEQAHRGIRDLLACEACTLSDGSSHVAIVR